MNLDEFTKEQLYQALKSAREEANNLRTLLTKAQKEIKEFNKKFKQFEVDRMDGPTSRSRFTVH